MKTVAIFMAGQNGDVLTATSVLNYRNELWGDCKIIWYIAHENRDLLKYQDIDVREFPRGFGYPEMVVEENRKLLLEGKEPIWEDWSPLVDENNHVNLELAKKYPSLVDINFGYYPAPHQMSVEKRAGIEYALCSKKIFGVPDSYEWHPVLKFSYEERKQVDEFMGNMKHKKTLCLETFAGSGQSILSHEQIKMIIRYATLILGEANFIFMSHKYLRGNENFPVEFIYGADIYFAGGFTVRQCALIVEKCDIFISVSSGISVAASAWDLKNYPPTLQYCGSKICSTISLNEGRKFDLVTYDERPIKDAEKEFEEKLLTILNEIK